MKYCTRQYFKIQSLWEAAMETERRCFSNINLESNVAPKISRSTESFRTVALRTNVGEWGYIERDLETIIVIVLLIFNLISKRSHQS